jgi:beta-fructofuranosidase
VPPAGYDPYHYRDPKVFRDERTGRFHMLITARLTDGRDGCIAQLVSNDLKK